MRTFGQKCLWVFCCVACFLYSVSGTRAAEPSSCKIAREQIVENPSLYKVEAKYPLMINPKNPSVEKAFNDEIQKTVKTNLQSFKTSVQKYIQGRYQGKKPPEAEEDPTRYHLDFEVLTSTPQIVSIRWYTITSFTGAAHSSVYSDSFNYDLQQNKALLLSDLFKPGSDYLGLLSKLSRADLAPQLKNLGSSQEDKKKMEEGTAPLPDNFKVFFLVPETLIVYFNRYQVASGMMGDFEVKIPFSQLTSLSSSVLSQLAKKSNLNAERGCEKPPPPQLLN